MSDSNQSDPPQTEKSFVLDKAIMQTQDRKLEHIQAVLHEDVESRVSSRFEDFILVHQAVPEVDLEDIDTSLTLFGKEITAPILIAGMTGGHEITKKINRRLAEAAERHRIPMGLGSQRAAIEDPSLVDTFSVAREVGHSALLIGNIGAPQLVKGYGIDQAQAAVEMIDADALAVHFNPAQEVVQPEGDTRFRGAAAMTGLLSKELDVPVIAKEVGSGISKESGQRLEAEGVTWVDVGGRGGTSWPAVEGIRGRNSKYEESQELGELLRSWGVSTPLSVVEVFQDTGLRIMATGGVRTGIDAAKLIRIGASVAGYAQPFLEAAVSTREDALDKLIMRLIRELKTAMFLTGAKNLDALGRVPMVVVEPSSEWLKARGYSSVLNEMAVTNPRQ